MATHNTILLKGELSRKRNEARCITAAITPGMLLLQDADLKLKPHPTAGGYADCQVALENSLIGDTIDDAYAVGDLVLSHQCQPGDELYMLVAAAAVAIVATDFLASAGDGTLKKAATTDIRLFQPLEAVDNSGGGSVARIKVRKL